MDNIDQASSTDPFQTGSRHIKWRGGLSKQERSKRSKHYHKNGIGFLFSSNSSTASGAMSRDDIEDRFKSGSLMTVDDNLHYTKEIADFISRLTGVDVGIDRLSILKRLPEGRQINLTRVISPHTNSKIDVIALRLSGSGKSGSFNITLRNRVVSKTSKPTSSLKMPTTNRHLSRRRAEKDLKQCKPTADTGNHIKGFENLLDSSAKIAPGSQFDEYK